MSIIFLGKSPYQMVLFFSGESTKRRCQDIKLAAGIIGPGSQKNKNETLRGLAKNTHLLPMSYFVRVITGMR